MTVGEVIDKLSSFDRNTEILLYNYDVDLVDLKDIKEGNFAELLEDYRTTCNYRKIEKSTDIIGVKLETQKQRLLMVY